MSRRDEQTLSLGSETQRPRARCRAFVTWNSQVVPIDLEGVQRVTIGRSSDAQVMVEAPTLSRVHAALAFEGDKLFIEDMQSRNGVFVDGRQIARQQLFSSSRVVLGAEVEIVVQLPEKSAPHLDQGEVYLGPDLAEAIAEMDRLALTNLPALITGEAGVGKEVAALYLHQRGSRSAGPFVTVDCGSLTEELAASLLFGYRAPDGAPMVDGAVMQADGGTLFLDEVGALPLSAQSALVRLLETGVIPDPASPRTVELACIASTTMDLDGLVSAQLFRPELRYLLAPNKVEIPPLRRRTRSIPNLVALFVADANRSHGRAVRGLSAGAMDLLRNHSWPGNVRELRATIERAVALAAGDEIGADALELSGAAPAGTVAAPETYDEQVRTRETELLLAALVKTAGNQTAAARLLEVSRRTLVGRIADHDLGKRIHSELALTTVPPYPEATGGLRALMDEYSASLLRIALEQSGGDVPEASRSLGLAPRRFRRLWSKLPLGPL